ncbi:hypothetical protein LU196_10380 [Pantoea sp. Mb-10]|uniref:hypothetical protein n=1 Tax=unclassified Pantoea TaxID=2630326 RepID=UPI001E571635|nr:MULTISPECIES: hypothetical protein [unclassified Pantoea]MCE0490453.1 hypothetical protein [Pantoea sp. Mb-10]MCE0501584.1 hypothetical protein [Pantoea sp. Pb-8]
MLNAILQGKSGRVVKDGISQSWRSVFKHYEDMLTAAFWTRINYLSSDAMDRFLDSLLGINRDDWGEFECMLFWPKYDFPQIIPNNIKLALDGEARYAEPDVVMNFEHAALIVEVKHPGGGWQTQDQWHRELYTYAKDDGAKSQVHFMALGNVPQAAGQWFSELAQEFSSVYFYSKEWDDVRQQLQHAEWDTPQDKRIVADCLNALSLYGIREPLLPWKDFYPFIAQHPLSTDFSFVKAQS